MRAAVLQSIGATAPFVASTPLVVEDLELDEPGPGEVLVRVEAAGLCHSDLSVVDGTRPRPVPMALGHEGAGVVEALGAGVDDLAVGDRVVTVFVPSCGACPPCAEGRPALCEPGAAANTAGTLTGGNVRLRRPDGTPVHHHLGVSCFAEHAVVHRRSLVRVDPELPPEHAALFGCAVLTGVGAVVTTAQVRAGESVAVVGLGGVGLAALLGALAAGARRVVAIDLDPAKRDLALELGATDTYDAADPECVAQVRAATGGGVEHAVETAGAVAALETAYAVTRRGGTTTTAGLSHPDRTMALQHLSLVAEERTLKGSYVGGAVPVRDVPRYVELFRRGRLPVDRLLAPSRPLGEVNAALDDLSHGRVVRQVLVP
ncbi:alcohol dehydrogenase catalytic domain-containing protein [Phycicoccus sp. CSK15P-2]|uniref:alcohol dehydrogenase catalytic domain-containing protein n=1 Tax=Phycicoccus sp. CSK15P-2 TaxID=2807627 RepID=UPI0019514EC3|nr:alcohol dehydrogenase catalytic domain-containing protein [Phycicoccus sp. CSK15P-2]MBM6404887.1 alcohol dehydrogenase catalytic domain-containing protein [Phycicoccus sp. CSK15P-2]